MKNRETTIAVMGGIAVLLVIFYAAWVQRAAGQDPVPVDTNGNITADLFINAEGTGDVQIPDGVRSVAVFVDIHDSIDPLTEQISVLVERVQQLEGEVAGLSVSVQAAHGPFGPETLDTRININTATAEELETLPGIGPSKATTIVLTREQRGEFTSVDQLTEVSGIGPSTLAALRPFVTVDP